MPSILRLSPANVGKQRRASLFNNDEMNDINPLTDPIAFETLLQDESLSEDVREIMCMTYERHRRVSS